MADALDVPPLPPELAYLFRWYLDAASGRASSGFGLSPLSWSELEAWACLRGLTLTQFELDTIRSLDNAFLRANRDGG